ncbi:MAG: hypothetical protein ABI867_29805 [Kofleriaceae bacterium]
MTRLGDRLRIAFGAATRPAFAGLVLALVVACGSKDPPPKQDRPMPKDPEGNPIPLDAPRQSFTISDDGVPDDPKWKQAAKAVGNSFTPSLNELEVTKVRVFPLKSPAGEVAPYLLGIEASKGDTPQFKGNALVGGGLVINGGGMKRLEAHLASIGFPKAKVPMGHLIEMLYLTGVVKAWVKSPALLGWEYFEKPQGPAQHIPAELAYDAKGALLTLYRDGGDHLDRIEIRFDDNALITTTTKRLNGSAWDRFTE